MTDNKERFNTGILDLDESLSNFYEFYNSNLSKTFIEKLKNNEITSENILDYISWNGIKVILSFTDKESLDEIIEMTNEDSHKILHETYKLISENFKSILDNENLVNVLFEKGVELGEIEDEKPYKPFNIPYAINAMQIYNGQPPELVPLLKLHLTDEDGDQIANIDGNWNDMFYLSTTILKALEMQISTSKELYKMSQLSLTEDFIEDFKEFTKDLKELTQRLDDHIEAYQPALMKD